MTNKNGILLTGAGGFLAGELLPRLLESYGDSIVYLLLRADSEERLLERRSKILDWAGIDEASARKVKAVAGNLERGDLGLGSGYEALANRVSQIYHSAACTRFDQKIEKARMTNLTGTENLIKFARAACEKNDFRRFHHVSTAYISGDRKGVIKEEDLNCGQGFFNTYEQSKYEAEMMLRGAGKEMPITIYRPSIIVGDSRSGRTLHFYVLYEPMKWFCQGQLAFLPCRPEIKLDIVPIDYVCDAMLEIGKREDSVGKTYHLSAGPERSIDMRELVDLTVEAINRFNQELGKTPMNPPEIVSPDMAEQFEGKAQAEFGVFFKRAMEQMQRHLPYAVSEKIFDDSQAREALNGAGIDCPSFRQYLPAIVRYGMEKQFRSEI